MDLSINKSGDVDADYVEHVVILPKNYVMGLVYHNPNVIIETPVVNAGNVDDEPQTFGARPKNRAVNGGGSENGLDLSKVDIFLNPDGTIPKSYLQSKKFKSVRNVRNEAYVEVRDTYNFQKGWVATDDFLNSDSEDEDWSDWSDLEEDIVKCSAIKEYVELGDL